ncbi:MAG: hypothetical protein IT355_13445 [Gemmatimonadaceae bacterium]|nr:hypothetical protein [Gemmatimonadaceae bacterium]
MLPFPVTRLLAALRALLALAFGICLVLPLAAQEVVAPAGWTSRRAEGLVLLRPPQVEPRTVFTVTVYAPVAPGAEAPDQWLASRADADIATVANASVERRTPVTPDADGIRSTSRVLVTPSGARLLALYFGVTPRSGRAGLVRVLSSSAALLSEHADAVTQVVRQVSALQPPQVAALPVPATPAAEATSSPGPGAIGAPTVPVSDAGDVGRISPNVVVRTPAPRRNGFRAGGVLAPGMYVGKQVYTDTREVLNEMTLWIYPSGEYRQVWQGSTREPGTGQFAYDPATGRIDLEWGSLMTIVNSRIEPRTDFAVMGSTDDGVPALLAENDRGFHILRTLLVRAGPNDRPSPAAMKAAEAAAAAEEARYKYVVAPGRGLQEAQIAGIHLHAEMHQTVGLSMQLGVSSTLSLYLLLSDGTVHDGVPVAPDEMDLVASRRREPERWGRWRRVGAALQVAWNVKPDEWVPLPGEPMVKIPPVYELRGRFSGGESSAAGDVGSYSLYGVTFGPGRTFETDSRGGTGTGSFTQVTGGTSVQVARDDEGSATVASTPGVIVTGTRRAEAAARSGTYRVIGWTLEARYDDGRVVRQPAFFLDHDRDAIYWQGKVVTLNRETR